MLLNRMTMEITTTMFAILQACGAGTLDRDDTPLPFNRNLILVKIRVSIGVACSTVFQNQLANRKLTFF